MSNDGEKLLDSEQELAMTVALMRRRGYIAARRSFMRDDPYSNVRLHDASMKYIAALEAALGLCR